MTEVRIEEFIERQVVFVRRYGPYQTSAMEAWQTLWSWVNEKGHMAQVKRVLGVSWDHPEHTTPSEIRYDACIEMHARVDGDPGFDVGVKTLPGGAYAVTLFEGPYQEMGPALRDLADVQVAAMGLEGDFERPVVEIYLNGPDDGPDAPRRTDLCVPVAR